MGESDFRDNRGCTSVQWYRPVARLHPRRSPAHSSRIPCPEPALSGSGIVGRRLDGVRAGRTVSGRADAVRVRLWGGRESVQEPSDFRHGEGDEAGRFVSAVSRWAAWVAGVVRKARASMARGDVPVPARTAADLVLVRAALVLRGPEAFLDRPPAAGDPGGFVDLGADGCVGEAVGDLGGIGHAAAGRHPAEVQDVGRWSSRSTRPLPERLVQAANTPIWQLSIFPEVPVYCRPTPAEVVPFLTNRVSSMISTPP